MSQSIPTIFLVSDEELCEAMFRALRDARTRTSGVYKESKTHYLVINHESYDSSTVFGILVSLDDAKALAESNMSADLMPTIEEWQDDYCAAKFAQHYVTGAWEEIRYDRDGQVQ